MEDLEESICRVQQAGDIMPQDHPNLAMYLNNFGRHLCLLFQLSYNDQGLKIFSEFMKLSQRDPVSLSGFGPTGHPVIEATESLV